MNIQEQITKNLGSNPATPIKHLQMPSEDEFGYFMLMNRFLRFDADSTGNLITGSIKTFSDQESTSQNISRTGISSLPF